MPFVYLLSTPDFDPVIYYVFFVSVVLGKGNARIIDLPEVQEMLL